MINNDQIESISVISTGSSSSYNSNTSTSSTGSSSSSSSSCSSHMSTSTPTNNSSHNSSANTSLSLSTTMSPSTSYRPTNNTSVDQISNDFNNIMSDLTNVCSTLNILAKQIDQIVSKIDDKFTSILEGLNNQQQQQNQNLLIQMNHKPNHQSRYNNGQAELIKDFKKQNDKNISLIQNTVKQNTKNYETVEALRTSRSSSNNKGTFSTFNLMGAQPTHHHQHTSKEDKLHQCKNVSNIAVCNINPEPKLKSKLNNNECMLMNIMKSNKDYETLNGKLENTRSLSDRRGPPKVASTEKSESYHRFNTFDQEINPIRTRNKLEFWSPTNIKTNNYRNYEETTPAVSLNDSSSLVRRCTRSKSQPAFNKDQITEAIQIQPKNVCPIIQNGSFNNAGFNQNSMFEFKTKNEPISRNTQESTLPESSYYEDQLDNELESLSVQSIGPTTPNEPTRPENLQLNKPTFNTNYMSPKQQPDDTLLSPSRKLTFEDSLLKSKKGQKSSSNHVSFNINNAIYSTRQEVPISIIKGSNVSNSPSVTLNKNGAPIQSSLKKSITTQQIEQQPEQKETTEISKLNRFFNMATGNNKSNRTNDTKTTVL